MSDLLYGFDPHSAGPLPDGGVWVTFHFANGYGASIISDPRNIAGPYRELCVLHYEDEAWVPVATTPKVLDYLLLLEEAEIERILRAVSEYTDEAVQEYQKRFREIFGD